ncbi:hypothetical protein [Pseudomonas sp.]|uniref:hypothetical protein n=1 Tax=Pseudomonas sp. TaxID=306 RepID=UPI0028966A2C|nr:hypothetical protein [Pseudomonas sp.]
MKQTPLLSTTALALGLFGSVALADQEPPPPGQHDRMPPPAAFEVCEGKPVGAPVMLTLPDGKALKGVCKDFQGRLAAMPEHMPPPPKDGAPPGSPPDAR